MVDQIVQLEGIDLAGVEANESFAHVFEQHSQLLLVVGADRLASRPASQALISSCFAIPTGAHVDGRY